MCIIYVYIHIYLREHEMLHMTTQIGVYMYMYIYIEAQSNFFRDPVKTFLHPLVLLIAHRDSSVLVGFDCARLAQREHKTANQRAPE